MKVNKPVGKRKGKNQIKTLKRLLEYVFKEYKLNFFIVIILILISSLANVASTLFLKTLIDDYITPFLGVSNPNFTPLLKAVGIMSIVYIIGTLSAYLYNRMMMFVAQGTLKKIRNDMFEHMEKLPIRYFDTHPHGEIMSLYTNDTDTLRQMISQSLPQLAASVATVVSVFISMMLLSIPLTFVALLMMFVMFKTVKIIGGKSSIYFGKQQQYLGKVNGFIDEMMEGQRVVKVFCHEDESKIDFDKINEQLCDSVYKANTFANILMPVIGNLGYINYVLTAIAGGFLAIEGVLGFTLGSLASFLQLTRNLNQPISQMSQQINAVIMALAGAERIFEMLDKEKETDEGYVTLVDATIDGSGKLKEAKERTGVWAWKHPHSNGAITYKRVLGDMVFDDVDFGYNDKKIILHNIDLYATPGQKVAFVGATGAGKTTITNLINRFYDIQDGKIRYDGININKIKKDDLRRSLGIVLQDTHLFTGTVSDNIRYGKLNATDEEVYAAAKLANADIFIKHLPKGYDTMITGDGANLSQGQRQLLAIARAAISNPPVLILDEATSSIDTRTESIVQEGMDKLMSGRTVFVIAHRLSTVKNSDVIMVLEQGKIIERGNHNSLLKQKGKYHQLYTGSFELQ